MHILEAYILQSWFYADSLSVPFGLSTGYTLGTGQVQ